MHTSLRTAAAALLVAAVALTARGMFMNRSVKVPVDRAVANVEKWIKDKPQDAQGYYVLGRLHSMAWAYGPDLNLYRPMTPARGGRGAPGGGEGRRVAMPDEEVAPGADPFNGNLPDFAPYDEVQVRRDEQKKEISDADAAHLREAILNYRKAAELDPKNALYELGLAWLLQETGKAARGLPVAGLGLPEVKSSDAEKAAYAAAIAKLGDPDPKVRSDATATLEKAMPKPFEQLLAVKASDPEVSARVDRLVRGYFDLQALEHYRRAYDLSIKDDLAKPGGLVRANAVISAEAGDAILKILSDHPAAEKPNESRELGKALKELAEKPRAMTPILFRMPRAGGAAGAPVLADLVDPLARTTFDLAGDDLHREWPWVRPGTSLLCWDPAGTGQVSSGRALFGSATWWIAFRNGYEALAILDDNADGVLTGDELQGIAAWTDANANGVSERGEVRPLAALGITAIAVRPRTTADGTLTIDRGITLSDGTTVPTFDWVTEPVRPATQLR